MEVHFTPEIEAKLNQLASETGRPQSEFVQDALEGYLDELLQIRETLDPRYDDLKTGRVKLMPGDEAFARLRSKSLSHVSTRE